MKNVNSPPESIHGIFFWGNSDLLPEIINCQWGTLEPEGEGNTGRKSESQDRHDWRSGRDSFMWKHESRAN
jgi:hypothetical protein